MNQSVIKDHLFQLLRVADRLMRDNNHQVQPPLPQIEGEERGEGATFFL